MLGQANIKDVKNKIGEWCKQKRLMYELSQDDLASIRDVSTHN
jgi:hypothetical protein